MPSTRDIRRRIKSVKNTAQITKAMQMVAAAKMRKAQQAALVGRPYADLMNEVLAEAAPRIAAFKHPLMETRPVRKRAVILVSTDKGLCGALNSNLFREAVKFDRNTTVFITAGRKAAQFVRAHKRQLAAEFTYKDTPQFGEARADFQIRAGSVRQGRSGRRGHFIHEIHFHVEPAARSRAVPADRKNRGCHGRRLRSDAAGRIAGARRDDGCFRIRTG